MWKKRSRGRESNGVFLGHTLAEANFLIERTRTLAFAEFAADDVIRRACTRSFDVDQAILWDAIQHCVPELKRHVEELLKSEC